MYFGWVLGRVGDFSLRDGCQTLAKKIAEKIKAKKDGPAKVFCNAAITRIELSSKNGARLWYKDTRDDRFVDEKRLQSQFRSVSLTLSWQFLRASGSSRYDDHGGWQGRGSGERDRPDEHE